MGKVSEDAAVVLTAATRFPPSRRPPQPRTPAEKKHIRQIGEIVHAWNAAHDGLFKVFQHVVSKWDYDLAHALWHSLQSDTGQRGMLEATVRLRLVDEKPFVGGGIIWAIKALNELSAHRNDFAHTAIIRGHAEVTAEISARRIAAQRLEETSGADKWRKIRGDLYAITNYLAAIEFAFWVDSPRPLARRPKLQFARTSSPKSQDQRRLAKKLVRERQRQSPRGKAQAKPEV